MAAFASQDSLIRTCSSLYKFRTPLCKKSNTVDFEASFVSSSGTDESKALIMNLNTARRQMLTELSSSNTCAMRLSCVDIYIPLISTLLTSLNMQPPVAIEKNFLFEWRGAFCPNEQMAFQQSNEIVFELGMALHTKAVLHYNLAAELLQGDVPTNLQVAGQNLRVAAGVLRYLALDLLPKWLAGPQGRAARPPELSEEVCLAYAELFMASAQQMAFVKAMSKVGGSPPGIMAKVGLGVVTLITGNYDPLRLLPDAKLHYSIVREVFKGMCNKYLAQMHTEKDDKGNAIGYCNEAVRHLQEQTGPTYVITQVGLPSATNKKHACPPFLDAARRLLLEEIEAMRAAAENENKIIFFLPVPGPADLPEPPAAAILNAATEYVPTPLPETGPIIFTYDKNLKPSNWSSFKVF